MENQAAKFAVAAVLPMLAASLRVIPKSGYRFPGKTTRSEMTS
jgi:hypothetical protein